MTIFVVKIFQPFTPDSHVLRPQLTCSFNSDSCCDKVCTRLVVLSSWACKFRSSFCSPSFSSAARDIARMRGNQSRFFSCKQHMFKMISAEILSTVAFTDECKLPLNTLDNFFQTMSAMEHQVQE